MDPKACLRLASECILDGDADGCLEHLGNYRIWRIKGGFEPVCHEHEFAGVVPCPEGGIQGDQLAQQLRIEARYALVGSAAYLE